LHVHFHQFKNPGSVLGYFKGIDRSREVKIVALEPGQIVTTRFAGTLGDWFAKSGVATQQIGISAAGRHLESYRVTRQIQVLESRSASTVDTWTQGRTRQVIAPQRMERATPATLTTSARCGDQPS
jgi:hypothetical protein